MWEKLLIYTIIEFGAKLTILSSLAELNQDYLLVDV